ncbi:hypothetical protein MASR1M45_15050 [Candidatus Kapaibacterium sp.]
MKYIYLAFYLIVGFYSCSSVVDIKEKRSTDFRANYDFEMFMDYYYQDLKAHNFKIDTLNSNFDKGIILARYPENFQFSMEIITNFDKSNRDVSIVVRNTFKENKELRTEYYNFEVYNSEYIKYFYSLLHSVKTNATKTAFPNRQ